MQIRFILFSFIILIINSVVNSQVGNLCLKCLSEGEVCGSLGNCEKETVCTSKTKEFNNNPECFKALEEGSRCQNNEQCILGLKCKFENPYDNFGKCLNIYYSQVNEKCENDFDCSGKDLKCLNNKCTRNPELKCGMDNPCQYGEYCAIPSRVCKKLREVGEDCRLSTECPQGTFCDGDSKKCLKVLSLKEGDKCQAFSYDQCNSTLDVYCGTSGVCEKFDLKNPGECLLMDNLCSPFHKCSCTDFKCHPIRKFGKEFADITNEFYDCANKHKCLFTINRFSSDSCLTKNCAAEFCRFNFAITPDNNLNCGRTGVKNYCKKYVGDNYLNKQSKTFNNNNDVSSEIIKKSKSNLVLGTIIIPIAILVFSIVVEIRLRKREKSLNKI